MKSLLLISLLLLGSGSYAHAAAKKGSEGVGGGAGVKKNGVYKTFYSAGLYVEPKYITEDEIEGLNDLIQKVSDMKFLGSKTKAKILEALIPDDGRKFFIVTPEGLTPEIKEKLLAEFSKVTHQEASQIDLFALTDKNQKVTYLLPEFFQLSTLEEKQAALMHEALWIVNPDFSYDDIVQTEMAFQAYLINPNNYAAINDFVTRVTDDGIDLITAALFQDKQNNALKGFLDANGKVNFEKLFGEDYFSCLSENNVALVTLSYTFFDKPAKYALSYDPNRSVCSALAKQNIYKLSSIYKKSMVLKQLLAQYSKIGLDVTTLKLTTTTPQFENGDLMEILGHKKANLIAEIRDFMADEYWLGTKILRKCEIDFSILSVKQKNVKCADTAHIKNISGSFGFGQNIK